MCVYIVTNIVIIDIALVVMFRCLESMISACGSDANAYIDSELLCVISCTLSSSNRFVRESTFTLLSAIAATSGVFL